MKKGLIIFFLLCCIAMNAQNACMGWAKNFGSTGQDAGKSVMCDALGNVYSTGTFTGTVDFDPGPSIFNLNGGTGACYILKLSPSGTFIWANMYGNITPGEMVFDASGNIHIVAALGGTADVDPSAATYTVAPVAGSDILVLKLDNLGAFVWAKTMGGNNTDYGTNIHVDPAGNVVTAGYFSSTNADFDPGPGTFTINGTGNDMFISKLDGSGNFVWAKKIDNISNGTYARALKTDASGNVFVGGEVLGTTDMDPGAGTFNVVAGGSADGYILKLDASGNFVWVKTFSGTSYVGVYDIELDGVGNIYSGGMSPNGGDYDPGAATYSLTGYSFISKLDNTGSFVWATSFATGVECRLLDLSVDGSGNVYSTGIFTLSPDFNQGPGIYNLTSSGKYDSFIHKTSSTGSFVWAAKIGGILDDYINSSCIDPSSNVIFTGEFDYICDFDPSPSTYSLQAAGSATYISDIFIEKLYETSPPTITPSGPLVFCQGGSVTLTSSSATTYSWNTGSTSQSISVSSSGNYSLIVDGCAMSAIVGVTANPIPTISVNSGTICDGKTFTFVPTGASTYTYLNGGPVVSPNITTSYSVTGTSSAGCVCANAGTALVTVNPSPTITVNSGTLCLGNSYTMMPSGANTYTYLNGGPVVTPASNSSYSITGTSALGCLSNNTAVCTVTVYSIPLPTITANSGSICAGTVFTIVPSGAITYTYSNGSNTVIPFSNTSYSVWGTDINGCISNTPGLASVTVAALPNITVNSGSICAGKTFTMIPGGGLSYTFSSGSSTVAPMTTTNYTVYGSGPNGCVGYAVSNVPVQAAPVIGVNSGNLCLGSTYTIIPTGAQTYTFLNGGPLVSPVVNSNYSVTGTNMYGCVSLSTVICSINILPLPTISVNSGSICFGQAFTITPQSQFNYTIAGGSNTVSPPITTSYTVVTTDGSGCSKTATSIVNVLPPPSMFIQSSQNPICMGKSATLSVVSSAQTFTWSTSSTNTAIVVTPFAPTNYTVMGTDANGCGNNYVITQNVDFCAGLNEVGLNEEKLINVFPNPTNGNVTIESNSEVSICLRNILGETIFSKTIDNNSVQLSIAHLPKGIYFITVKKDDKAQTLKLILN
jgi:hypothetical protein